AAIVGLSASALAQTVTPNTSGKLKQAKPESPMGCKLVGTVKGTKLWAGDCAAASELRGTTSRSNPPRRLSSKQIPQLQNSRPECCPRSAAHRPLNRPQKIMLRENARHGSALPAGLLLGLLV